MENGHRNSGFSHEKWWIFPLQIVSSPEGNMDDDWGYPYDFGNLRNIPWPHPAPSTAPMRFPGVPRRTMVRELLDWVLWTPTGPLLLLFEGS